MAAKQVSDNSFESDIINAKGYVLIDFWAPWCGPCKQLAPVLDELATELSSLSIYKMNIDENPETPSRLGVRGIPTLILFKDGKQVATKVGSLPKAALNDWIKSETE
jgi:thioredoxin 1